MNKLSMQRSTVGFIAGALLLIVVVQVLIPIGFLTPFWITLLMTSGVMAIVAVGLNLIYGFNGQFSNKLLVLVDGRAIYQSATSGVPWEKQLLPVT